MDNTYGIGDILLFTAPVANPYRRQENADSELVYNQRKAAFDHLRETGTLPDHVKEVWHAPCSGGARKLALDTVRYQNHLIYGIREN
jgi:hypothetical protein